MCADTEEEKSWRSNRFFIALKVSVHEPTGGKPVSAESTDESTRSPLGQDLRRIMIESNSLLDCWRALDLHARHFAVHELVGIILKVLLTAAFKIGALVRLDLTVTGAKALFAKLAVADDFDDAVGAGAAGVGALVALLCRYH
jgi:hypothetical protein